MDGTPFSSSFAFTVDERESHGARPTTDASVEVEADTMTGLFGSSFVRVVGQRISVGTNAGVSWSFSVTLSAQTRPSSAGSSGRERP